MASSKRTMKSKIFPNYSSVSIPMKKMSANANLTEQTSLMKKVDKSSVNIPSITFKNEMVHIKTPSIAKPGWNAIVWSLITAAFMVSIIVITGTAVAIEKSATGHPADSTIDGLADKWMMDDFADFHCADPTVDCNGHGVCDTYYGCRCDEGYTTHKPEDDTMCNYKQKSQLTAFLLSLFLGEFGAGRFYAGDTVLGVVKLLLIICGCCLTCVCSFCVAPCLGLSSTMKFSTDPSDHFDSDSGVIGMLFALFCGIAPFICSSCALSIWWIVDVILFATNSIKDENGVELAPM